MRMKKILCTVLIGLFTIQGTAWGMTLDKLKDQINGCNEEVIKNPQIKTQVTQLLEINPPVLTTALDKKKLLDAAEVPTNQKELTKHKSQKERIAEIISYFLEILNGCRQENFYSLQGRVQDKEYTERHAIYAAIQKIREDYKTQLVQLAKDLSVNRTIVANFFKNFSKEAENHIDEFNTALEVYCIDPSCENKTIVIKL